MSLLLIMKDTHEKSQQLPSPLALSAKNSGCWYML